MTEYRRTVEIQAPPERVWSVMSEVERWPEWTQSITHVERLDGGPFGVGSRVRVRQPRLPPALWTVTELEPGRGFTWTSRGPGILVTASHEIARADGGSRVTLILRYGGLLGGVLARLTHALNERYLGYEAEGLKRRSESTHDA